ncbi:MAG: deoxyhypusine synthase family protein [archaeon]|nr:deoxyhypusine synthase family protein [Candidatus Bathyarchaeum sp.]
MIEQGYVHAVVTTGTNMVHDLVESIGHRHYIGTFLAEDTELMEQDIGRIGDL